MNRTAARRQHRSVIGLVALFLGLMVVVTAGSGAQRARAVGEGNFFLDASAYATDEGTVLNVAVRRDTDAALLSAVTVVVRLSGGFIGRDYAPTALSPQPPAPVLPAVEVSLPVRIAVTFEAGSTATLRQLGFQTLNRNSAEDSNDPTQALGGCPVAPPIPPQRACQTYFITIESVSAGLINSPASSPLILQGIARPRVDSIFPHSGNPPVLYVENPDGTTVRVTGRNFLTAGYTYLDCFVVFYAVVDPFPEVGRSPCLTQSATVVTAKVAVSPPYPHETEIRVELELEELGPAPPPTVDVSSPRLFPGSKISRFVITTGVAIENLSPPDGTYLGGNRITITGSGFPSSCTAIAIDFDGKPGTDCDRIDDTHISVLVPESEPKPPGVIDVVVTVGATLPSPKVPESKYTYTGGPNITSVSPASGPVSGGTRIVIIGSGFQSGGIPAEEVLIGGSPSIPANSIVVVSDSEIRAVTPNFNIGAGGPGPGTYRVTVVHPEAGESPPSAAAAFTYTSGPVVFSLSPASGPPTGGTIVEIRGANFSPGVKVRFGTVDALNVVFNGNDVVRAEAPPGNGVVDVRVRTATAESPNTPADDFTYSAGELQKIEPNAGPMAGGTLVKVTGSSFTGGTKIRFDGVEITPTFVSAIELRFTTPPAGVPLGPKEVSVEVVTLSGPSNSVTFTFTDGPIVSVVNPNEGPSSGGNIVIITGTGFIAGSTVKFGALPASSAVVNSATQITAIAPAVAAPGAVQVRVTSSAGVSPVSLAARYTYKSTSPLIQQLVPAAGPSFGGNKVTLTGSGFTGVVCPGGVKVGFQPVDSCTVDNDSSLTIVMPPNSVGAKIVVVTTANGTSNLDVTYLYEKSVGPPPAEAPPPDPGPQTYQLHFRWTLITWAGKDGLDVIVALQGTSPANDLRTKVTAVFQWDEAAKVWRAFFPPSKDVPGANEFDAFKRGFTYWIAILGPAGATWTVSPN